MFDQLSPTNAHLSYAINLWGLDSEIAFHRHLANYVYFGSRNGKKYVLRLTPAFLRTINEINFEIDFQNFLLQAGLNVTTPIKSNQDELVEELRFEGLTFYAVLFEFVGAQKILDEETLKVDFLFKWGKYLGDLHNLSITYKPNELYFRNHWDLDSLNVTAQKNIPNAPLIARNRFNECIEWLKDLEMDKDNYGVIHGDLHRGNIFIVNSEIISFDFDDSCFSWFLNDLTAPMATVLKLVSNEEDRLKIINKFIEGYVSVRPIEKKWLDRFEAFYQYRLVLVYHWMNSMIAMQRFSSDTVKYWKETEAWYLENMKRIVVFK